MEIDIIQEEISLRAEYKIHIDQNERYHATKKLFSFSSEIDLFEKSEGRTRYQIIRTSSGLNVSYHLIRYDNNRFEFRSASAWKIHYGCQVGADLYEVLGHRERKYSISKNDNQVAWWDKERVSWFSGDNYKMIVDKDSDVALLICFCLIVDDEKSSSGGNMLNIDFGNIGPQEKEFNADWKPKK